MPRRHESPPKYDVDLSKSPELTVGRPAQTRVQLKEGGDQPSLVQEAEEGRKEDRVNEPETLRKYPRKRVRTSSTSHTQSLCRGSPKKPGVSEMVRSHRLRGLNVQQSGLEG